MMNETQKLMLGVEALRMVYPEFSIGHWNKQEIKEDYMESQNLFWNMQLRQSQRLRV